MIQGVRPPLTARTNEPREAMASRAQRLGNNGNGPVGDRSGISKDFDV